MKKITTGACLLAVLTLATACGGSNDEKKTDSSQTTVSASTETTSTDHTANMPADSPSTSANASTGMEADQQFMLEAAKGGMMEVDMGKLAETNAASPKVKAFGKMMVTDHTKANNELKALAAKKNVTLPPPDETHMNDMKDKKGKDFDNAYVDMMVSDHEKNVAKFEDEAANGKDADVKAFAAKTLPTLKMHLTKITELKAALKM